MPLTSTSAEFAVGDGASAAAPVGVAASGLGVIATRSSFRGVAGTDSGTTTLATFADDDPNATGGFTAAVGWGDGQSGTALVVPAPDGTFVVKANHLYARAGQYTVFLDIHSADGARTTASLPAPVSAPVSDPAGTVVGGVAGVPTGPMTVATFTQADGSAALDTARIDWGDGGTSAGKVVAVPGTSNRFEVDAPHGHTWSGVGNLPVVVTVTDAGGGTHLLGGYVSVLNWTNQARQVTVDPNSGHLQAFGEAQVAPGTGDVRLTQALDFDQSPGTGVGRDPALVYNSGTVGGVPRVRLDVTDVTGRPRQPGQPGGVVPDSIRVWFAWEDQGYGGPFTYTTAGHQPGDDYLLDLPAVAVPGGKSGVYDWTARVQFLYGTGGGARVAQEEVQGDAAVVDNDASAVGAGWGIAGVDRLAVSCGAVLWVSGAGDGRVFHANGDGTYDNPTDFGGLVRNLDGTFTYTAKDRTAERFDADGRLTAVVDAHGLATTYAYAGDDLVAVTASDGGVTTFSYDAATGLLDAIDEPGGRVWALSHSGTDLTGVLDPAGGGRSLSYDGGHRVTSDSWSPYQTSFTWDDGFLVGVTTGGHLWRVQPQALSTRLGPDGTPDTRPYAALSAADARAEVLNPLGYPETWTLADDGRPLADRRADGATRTWVWDAYGQLDSSADFLGLTTAYAYDYSPDGKGDLLSVTRPDGGAETMTYEHVFHHVTKSVDPAGIETDFAYDAGTGDLLGRTVAPGTAAAATTLYSWAAGLLVSVTDPALDVTLTAYDGSRRKLAETDAGPDGATFAVRDYTYDAAGDVATLTDGDHGVTTYATDGVGRAVATLDATNVLTTQVWTASGLAASGTDGRGVVTAYAYDARGLLVSSTLAAGSAGARTTAYAYDAAGDQTLQTSPLGEPAASYYDIDGRAAARQDADGYVSRAAFDADGRATATADADLNVTTDLYDALGELVSTRTVARAAGDVVRREATTYDRDGNVTGTTDGDNNVTTNTYVEGRLASTQTTGGGLGGDVVSREAYTRDANGDVTRNTDGDNNVTVNTYDGDRLASTRTLAGAAHDPADATAVTEPGADGLRHDVVGKVSYAYDADGNVLTSTDGDGNVTTNTYDGDDRLVGTLTAASGTGDVVRRQATGYDADGNVLTSTDGDGNVTSDVYDAEGELTSTRTVAGAAHDPAHVSAETELVGNVPHDVVRRSASTYDGDGNVLTSTDGGGDVTTNAYDDGRLAGTRTTGGLLGDVVRQSSSTLDGDGNVLTSTDGDGNVTTNTYDGDRLATTWTLAGAAHDADNTRAETAPGADGLRHDVVRRAAYAYDGDGNVTGSTDGDGNVTTDAYDGGRLVGSRTVAGAAHDPGNMQAATVLVGDVRHDIIRQTATTYDACGNVLTTTDGDGNVTTNTYDGGDLATTVTVGGLLRDVVRSGKYAYDEDGNVLRSTDGDGNVTFDAYDGGRLATTRTVAGAAHDPADTRAETEWVGNVLHDVVRRTATTRDADGNVLTSTDGDGNVTTDTYDGGDLATTVTVSGLLHDVVRSGRYAHDEDGNVTSSTDGDNNVTTDTYDGGQLAGTLTVAALGHDVVGQSSSTRDADGNVVTSTDGDGNVTTDTYDGDNLATTVTVSGLLRDVTRSEKYAYDEAGNVLTTTDGDGNVTTDTYDGGQLATTRTVAGATHDPADATAETVLGADGLRHDVVGKAAYAYDEDGNRTGTSDGDGNVTFDSYDGGRLAGTWTFGGALGDVVGRTTTTRDADGNVLTSTDGDGNVTTNTYDGGDLATAVTVSGLLHDVVRSGRYAHDEDGNVLTSTDGDLNVTTNSYDGDRLVSSTDGDSNVTTDAYDPAGNVLLTRVKDALGILVSTTTRAYDGNRLATSTDGDNNVTTDTYDPDGNLLSVAVTDAAGVRVSGTTNAYDGGRLVTSTDGDNNVTTDTYDTAGNVLSTRVTDAAGALVSRTADAYDGNRLRASTDGDGNVTTTTYDEAGNALSAAVTDAAGVQVSKTTNAYDGNRLITSTDGGRNVTTETYDGDGNVLSTRVQDALGILVSGTTRAYDGGRVATSTDGDGNVTTNTYDADGNLVGTRVRDGLGAVVSSSSARYDGDGNVLAATDGDGHVTSTAYDAGRVLTSTDGDGNVTTNTYDADGNRLSTAVRDGAGSLVSSVVMSYDGAGRVLTSTDGDNNVTTNTYDGDGNAVSAVVTDAGGVVVSRSAEGYDGGRLVATTDGDNNVTTSTYDPAGNTLGCVVTDAGGAVVSSSAMRYDGNRLVSSTDGDNNVTTDTYDEDGNAVTIVVTDAAHVVVSGTTDAYDGNRLVSSTDGDNNVTTETYDLDGNTLSRTVIDAAHGVVSSTTRTYDDNRLWTSVDGDHNVTTDTYDPDGNLLSGVVTDAGGAVVSSTTRTYDGDGNVLTSTDAPGDVTADTYDGGRLLSTTVSRAGAVASRVRYGYDLDGNRTSLTDGDNNVTTDTYDGGNVVGTVVTTGSGAVVRATSATFDPAGHQTSATDGANRTITSTYDGGRLVGQTWRNADGTVQNVLSWTYDADGNLVAASSNAGGYAMTYDGDRLMTRTDPTGLTLTYAYDDDGNVSSISDSQGGVTGYAYDGGRVSSKTYHNGATAYRVDFTYDGDGGLLSETRYADLAGTVGVGSSAYGYDGGRLISVTHRDGGGATLANYGYVYDTAGRLSSETDDGVTTGYAYDAAGQLTQAGGRSYTYDLNGNRNAAGNVVGPDNELLSDATGTYTYDAAGQMTGQTNADGTSWTYGYDAAGNQTSAVQKAADGTVTQSVADTYDVFGNRIAQTVTTAGGTATLRSVYDASNSLYADENGSGAVGTRYLTGVGGPDHYLARADGSGVETLLPDHNGSVRVIVSASAGVLDRIGYGEFGTTVSETNAAAGGRLGFQSGELDRATGKLRFGERQLTPRTGRWGEPDRTGFGGGDANLYRFVGNGPTNGTDPTGQFLVVDNGAQDQWMRHVLGLGASTVAAVPLPGGDRVGIMVPVDDFDKLRAKSAERPADDYWSQGVVRAVTSFRGYDLQGGAGAGSPIKPTKLDGREVHELLQQNARFNDGDQYHAGAYAEDQSLTGAFAEGLGDGAVIVGNQLTFRLIPALDEQAQQLIKDNGGAYEWADVAGQVAREALVNAATLGAGQAVGALSRVPKLAKMGEALVKGARAVGGMAPAWVGEAAAWTACKIVAPLAAGAKQVQVAAQVAQVGQALVAAYSAVVAGQDAEAARQLAKAGFGSIGLKEGIKESAAMLKVLREKGPVGLYKLLCACFAAGTPLLVPGGSRPVEELRPGDWVLSWPEEGGEGPVEARRVEEVFTRTGRVLTLRVGGREVGTTSEHPFWVRGEGWKEAGALAAGDLLRGYDGRWSAVEGVEDTGRYETVYNLRVAEYHTYFVGCDEWGLDVWAHNADGPGGCTQGTLFPEDEPPTASTQGGNSLSDKRSAAAKARWDRVRAGEADPHAGRQGNADHQAVQSHVQQTAGGETEVPITLTNGRARNADNVDAAGRIHQIGDMRTRGGLRPDGQERGAIEDIRKVVGPDRTIIYHDKLGQQPSLINPDLQDNWRPATRKNRFDP